VGGLSLAFLGQDAILSDIGELQALQTQGNINRNRTQIAAAGGSASYVELDWNRLPDRASLGPLDVVCGSDVIWHETLVEPFVQAVAWALSGPGPSEALLSHKVRDEESVLLFDRKAAEAGLVVERRVKTEELLGADGHPDVTIYHIRRRQ